MLLLTVLVLTSLSVINYRLSGRALFHPAVVYCSAWAMGLGLIWAVGDFFFPLSGPTLLIFIGGAITFSVGSAIVFWNPKTPREEPTRELTYKFIKVWIVVILCCTPLAIQWMFRQIAEHPSSNFFVSASLTMLDESLQETTAYSFFANLITVADMIALVTFCEKERYKKLWVVMLCIAILLNAMTAGRSGLVTIILAILCLDWLLHQRIRWKLFVTLGVVFSMAVVGLAVYLGKGEAKTDASLAENAGPVFDGLVLYASGSLVAFDRVIRDPNITPHSWRVTNPFEHLWHKIDPQFEPNDTHTEFLAIGPHNLAINTFTGYFAYIDLGYVGMILMPMAMGLLLSMFYKRATAGSKIWKIIYAYVFAGIPLSLFGEYFFLGINFTAKFYFLLWFLYAFPVVWDKLGSRNKMAVTAYLKNSPVIEGSD